MRMIFLFYLVYISVIFSKTKITIASILDLVSVLLPTIAMLMYICNYIDSNIFGLILLLNSSLTLLKMMIYKMLDLKNLFGIKAALTISTILGATVLMGRF